MFDGSNPDKYKAKNAYTQIDALTNKIGEILEDNYAPLLKVQYERELKQSQKYSGLDGLHHPAQTVGAEQGYIFRLKDELTESTTH